MIVIEKLKDGLYEWANSYNLKSANVIFLYEDAGQPDVPYITLDFLTGINRISQHDDNRYNLLSTIVLDADFVTGNKINLKIDSISMTEVDFITDHDTTAQKIIEQILEDFNQVSFVGNSENFRNLMFTHKTDGDKVTISDILITGGASQAGATVSESDGHNIAGIRVFTLSVMGYGVNAFEMLFNLQSSLSFSDVLEDFRALGIAMNSIPIINNITTLLEVVFEKRYSMDIGFNIASNVILSDKGINVLSDGSVIEDTDIQGQLNGQTVNISVDT